ncbi:hypothetical protein V1519DRAFT_469134 [Lipomyces tetrasporus]
MFVGNGGKSVKSCKNCRDNAKAKVREQEDASYNLDEHFESHEDIIEVVSSFLECHDEHKFSPDAQPLKLRVTLSESFVLGNDVSVALCAQTEDRELQKQAASHLRNDIFDCSGYYFHLRRCKERADGPEFILTCSRSHERKTERDPETVQRYTTAKEFFVCHGELRIAFLKANPTATITYDHKCHTETPKFHVTEENLIRLADSPQFKNTELHKITRQQVYNIWLSLTRKEWERDAADDFRSAQLLLEGQDGYRLIEGLQEPGVSLGFITPCFSDSLKYDRAKITEVSIDSTFGPNKHGYELYCVLTEYDLVSLPLSYLLLDTRGLREVGKKGTRLTAWLTALRAAGLNPNVVHTDKDFAEVTAASLAFKRNDDRYNHHLCLWHSMRAVDQYITGKMKCKGFDSIGNTRNSTRLTALSQGSKQCNRDQARTLRGMIKRHLLRHPVLPKPFFDSEGSPAPEGLLSSNKVVLSTEMLEYCKSIDQPKLFRYFWNNWYRPDFKKLGSNATIPISRTTMRLEILTYIVCTGLVRSRMHLYSQVEAGREKPSAYKDFVHLWRKCAEAINHNTIVSRDEVYHTNGCAAFDGNGRFVVQPPPSYTPQLFQESLPLIRFSQHDIKGPATISRAWTFSNDDSTSVSYAEELKSLELVPAEDPEAAEENDENISDFMRVVHWASGPVCESNPRLQRAFYRYVSNNAASFLAEFKRPYEEAVGISRSVSTNTMRKAAKPYYYSRPQNLFRAPGLVRG